MREINNNAFSLHVEREKKPPAISISLVVGGFFFFFCCFPSGCCRKKKSCLYFYYSLYLFGGKVFIGGTHFSSCCLVKRATRPRYISPQFLFLPKNRHFFSFSWSDSCSIRCVLKKSSSFIYFFRYLKSNDGITIKQNTFIYSRPFY